jgi:hypothetical protein
VLDIHEGTNIVLDAEDGLSKEKEKQMQMEKKVQSDHHNKSECTEFT